MELSNIILSIDVGTQSIRTVLFDLKGSILEIVKTEIDPYFSDKPGWAEQDPEYFWEKLSESTQLLFNTAPILKSQITAVTLTTQRGTLINIDQEGKPLRPAMIWLDQRQAEASHFPKGLTKMSLSIIKLKESVVQSVKNAECNWIRQNQPEIWEKTDKFLFLSGYLTYKLIDKFHDSVANIVGYVPFDYKKQQWAKENNIVSKMFPIEREKLPLLFKPSEILGNITHEASLLTGIPEGLPLIAAAADKASEVLGSGVISPDVACLSYGTTATVQTVQKNYVEVLNFLPPYPGAIFNTYHTEIMIYRGFWMINWFKKQFGHREKRISKKTGIPPEQLFDDMIKDIPPGSMGLTLQPYWSPGVRKPGTEAKGAIIGFGDVHTRAHIYRAILEGLAYALKEGLIRTEKKTHTNIQKIIVSGGGSQSEMAMQLTADIFDLPVVRPSIYETSALGAAINAAMGMHYFDTYEQAIEAMCHAGKTFYPIPENRDLYNKLYHRIYKKMYGRLERLYHEIREITGYPE
jgi:sugar (pentulose or hexulose) kinase